MATALRPNIADFYERDVLPALAARLDETFPEFGWRRDARGWHATNQAFTHSALGVRADRVVCHGSAPRGFLVHGEGPVLWTTYVNRGRPSRGRDFVDAVRAIATRAGVDASPLDRPPTREERRAKLLDDAFVVMRRELAGPRGETARAFLKQRGIPTDHVRDTGLGVMPDPDRLRLALVGMGHSIADIHASQLLGDGRWPGRVVGAWRDHHRQIATLWARTTDHDDDARYLYLRGAPRAAATPYGLADLRAQREGCSEVVLVEGVLDVHTMRANGVQSVVALGGTATSRALFETLADVGVDHVILALDNDPAGRIATTKAIDHAVKASRSPTVWVIDPDLLGTAKDPGQLIQTGGRDAWLAARAAPVCGVTWRALDLTGPTTHPDTPLVRRAALAHATTWLATLPPRLAVEQVAALDTVAHTLNYNPNALQRSFQARHWDNHPAREPRPTMGAQR